MSWDISVIKFSAALNCAGVGITLNYRPEIDGLRAVAVLPVILFHAGFGMFSGGFVGVDVFFVISGYLITNIIYREIEAGNFSIAGFYERRARRILPALFTVIIACIPFAYLWMFPQQFKDFSQSLVAVSVFASNILFWLESGYFDSASELKPLLHTWSLAIEEQFYIFFPLLLMLFSKMPRRFLIFLVAAVSILSFIIAEYGSRYYPAANFYLLPSRAWELGAGALLALAIRDERVGKSAFQYIGSVTGFVMIIVSIFAFDESTRFPSVWALLPVTGTVLVIACSGSGDIVGRILAGRSFVAVGLISYSAYLWHQPLFAFARIRSLDAPGLPLYIALIGVTFMLAYLSWKFIELPFRNRRQMSVGMMAKLLSPAVVLVCVIGLLGHKANGFYAHAPLQIRDLDLNAGLGLNCDGELTETTGCATSAQPEFVVWGDSYAAHLVPGLLASDAGVGLVQKTKNSCAPILDFTNMRHGKFVTGEEIDCLKFNDYVRSYLSKQKSIKYAVLSSPFTQFLADGSLVYDGTKVFEPTIDDVVAALSRTVSYLDNLGIKATIVSPPPRSGKNIGDCLAKSFRYGRDLAMCDFSAGDYKRENPTLFQLLSGLEKNGVNVVFLDRLICDSAVCKTHADEIPLYRDSGHLSKRGSAYLGSKHDFRNLFAGR